MEVLSIGDLDVSGAHMPLALAEDVAAFADDHFRAPCRDTEQVKALGLPTAPPKPTDKRAFHETCQREAIPPEELARIVREGIERLLPARR